MALNFTVSYTYSPNTTIASAQVNTNTSDVANVFTGLEALTKTLAKLKVDVDPTTALEVATKQYVDHYAAWRRPNLVYNSATVVNVETGIDGTSGEVSIQFPDGSKRTDSTTGRVQCNLAQVAALSGTWQSGLRTGAVANNTCYAIYMVKTTDDTSKMVAVADTVYPTQANFATLNSNFGSNGWVYIGYARYGDQAGSATGILKFVQAGNLTIFSNVTSANSRAVAGLQVATSNSASTTTNWQYAAGTSGATVPSTITHCLFTCAKTSAAAGNSVDIKDFAATYYVGQFAAYGAQIVYRWWTAASEGASVSGNAGTGNADINISGWIDGVLGVGSNPIL